MKPFVLSEAAFDILLSLVSEPRHGYAMVQDIQERREGQPMQPGLLYTTLPKLMEVGLVTEVAPPASSTDKRRRYYQITPGGLALVTSEAQRRLTVAQRNHALVEGLA